MSFLDEHDISERGRDARDWLLHDERGRVVGLVLVSLLISIAMTLLVTWMVGVVGRRRAEPAVGPKVAPRPEPADASESAAAEDDLAGIEDADVVEAGA